MTDADLKQLLTAATNGPWGSFFEIDHYSVWSEDGRKVGTAIMGPDARLIALSPTLAQEVLDLRAEVARADVQSASRAALEPAAPSVSAAEAILARLDPEALRPILSRLANHTPNSCYYSKDFGESMRALPEKAATEAGKMLPLEQGLMFVAATAADRLAPGDKLDAEFTSLMHGAKDIGSYRVQIERLATKENSDE